MHVPDTQIYLATIKKSKHRLIIEPASFPSVPKNGNVDARLCQFRKQLPTTSEGASDKTNTDILSHIVHRAKPIGIHPFRKEDRLPPFRPIPGHRGSSRGPSKVELWRDIVQSAYPVSALYFQPPVFVIQ